MKSILVVVDMQNDFINGTLGSKAARETVPKVYEKIKTFNGIIIGTMDTHNKGYFSTQEGLKLPVIHCIEGTSGWKLNKDIAKIVRCKAGKDDFYEKNTFGCVDLAEDLADAYNDYDLTIELIGLLTDKCVISNALLFKAYMPNAIIIVDANCCCGSSPEAHAAALLVMKSCHIDVINEV